MAEENRTEVLSVRLARTEADLLRAKAAAEQRPISQWLRLELLRMNSQGMPATSAEVKQ